MHERVFEWTGKIRRSLTGIVRNDLDMTDVPGATAARAVEEFATIERLAAIGKLKAAARVADTDAWRDDGEPDVDMASWLSRKTGTTKRESQRCLDAAKRMAELPATKEAAESGELSQTQLQEITDGADADPDAEQGLLDSARDDSVAELKDKAKKARASAGDRRTRHERIRRSRFLRHGTDAEGAFWLTFRNTGDVGAEILAVLRPFQDRIFRRARSKAVREPSEAYAADALVDAMRAAHGSAPRDDTSADDGPRADGPDGSGPDGGGPDGNGLAPRGPDSGGRPRPTYPPRPRGPRPSRDIKVIVRIDHTAYRRGHTVAGEVCDIVGVGPVPVATVREMMDDAFLAAIVTDGHEVRAVAHLGRGPNAHQQTALDFMQPACEVLTCPRTGFLQADHRTGYAITRNTVLDDLDRLCEEHHEWKTNRGWRLEPGTGQRRFLSPEEQRARGLLADPEPASHDPPGDAA